MENTWSKNKKLVIVRFLNLLFRNFSWPCEKWVFWLFFRPKNAIFQSHF